MTHDDILERLQNDPGQLTLGQLLQERGCAAQEIERLRDEIKRLREFRSDQRIAAADTVQAGARPSSLIRLSEVCNVVGLSRSTIYLRLSKRQFPQPVRIGPRSVRWRMEDIEDWTAGFD